MSNLEKFVQSDDLLVSVILRQAGTAIKAIQEAVQNAKDSKASKIVVTSDSDGFSVEDNGCGMTEQVINDHFRVFGNSAKKGVKGMIGEFGMGRGQIFAQGVTDFYTLNIHLRVDLREGFGYTKETIQGEPVVGTKVVCKYFESKASSGYPSTRSILSRFMFKDAILVVNGEMSVDITKAEPTLTAEGFAAYLNNTDRSSRLFVKGIFVSELQLVDAFNVLVDDLTLNFARNDLIEDDKAKEFHTFCDNLEIDTIRNYDKRKSFAQFETIVRLFGEE